jgi:propionate CoA-transferase
MKVVTAREAAALLRSDWTVTASGFGGFGHPEALTDAIERRFLEQGEPRNLTLLFAASNGDRRSRGMNHLAHERMVRKVIAGGWRGTPKLGELALQGRIEAYNWPQGVLCQLFRAIAAGQPGVITRTGLGTFVDPRLAGGALNDKTPRDVIRVIDIGGRDYLLYPAQRIDCALVRATAADARGNLSLEHEAFSQDMLAMAQAARNSGGIVIAQVKRLAEAGTLDLCRVRVPGMLVDYVVVTESEDQHWMSFGEKHNPAYLGEGPPAASKPSDPGSLDLNRIIQRRAFLELQKMPGAVVNLGIGIPSGVSTVAAECGYEDLRLTIESGVIGGIAAEELSFGAASHPEAVIDQSAQFDFYSGGGLDIGFLGMLQVDAEGDVNVGRVKDQIVGVGGFIDIAQNAKAVCFVGAFTASGLRVESGHGKLRIEQEGKVRKFVPRVDQKCFGAPLQRGKKVLYITERAVFGLNANGLELREVAPGIDVKRDLLDLLPEGVRVPEKLATMDARIFDERFLGAGA